MVRGIGRYFHRIAQALAITFCAWQAASAPRLPAQNRPTPAPPAQAGKSMVELTREELLQVYSADIRGLEFEENPAQCALILEKVGEKVEMFFRDFPKTLSKEQVRLERMDADGRVLNAITRNYSYSFSPSNQGASWMEDRTESNGRPVDFSRIKGFFLANGRAGMSAFLHPIHQNGSRFRYLGRQASNPEAYLIAFAQKPEIGDYLGSYQSDTMAAPVPILYQGLVWVDPRTFQIVRMRTELLTPRNDIGLYRQTSDVWLGEVRFQSVPESYWLPREVVVTNVTLGSMSRCRHRYSDYQIFLVESQEKFELPKIKK
jgi:hypothetical protein